MRHRSYQNFQLTPIWVLIGTNLLVYLATMTNWNFVITNFGFQPASFLNEPWTIITSMFVHGSFFHLFANMLMLYFFGSYILRLIGENKFLLVYFAAGLAGNVLYLLLGPDIPAVGASGALYGVMGALAVMRPRMKVYLWFIVPIDLWIVVIIGALIMSPNIAWQAHLGGLGLGLTAGYFFRKREGRSFWR